jgi:hypothetical protein
LHIPYYQFRSKSIVEYSRWEGNGRFIRTERQRISAKKLTDETTYTGVLCAGAKKRLTKCLELLIQYAKPKTVIHEGKPLKFSANFITLTIYNYGTFVPGKEAHKALLEPFIKWMRDNHDVGMYLWKAELQSNRADCAQLHYHFTTDTYFHKTDVQNKWNELQRRAGYLDTFFEKFGHWDAPSTKIHALYKKRDPVAYIKKEIMNYSDRLEVIGAESIRANKELHPDMPEKDIIAEVTKLLQNKYTIGGKVWDCSMNLKSEKYYTYSPEAYDDVTQASIDTAVKEKHVQKVVTDTCTIYKVRTGYTWQLLPRQQRQEYFKKADDLLNFKRVTPVKKAPPDIIPPSLTVRKVNFYVEPEPEPIVPLHLSPNSLWFNDN